MYFRCELVAIEAGDREKAQMFKKKSLDLAGSISDNFRRIMLESGREQAEELSAMIELIKNLGSWLIWYLIVIKNVVNFYKLA